MVYVNVTSVVEPVVGVTCIVPSGLTVTVHPVTGTGTQNVMGVPLICVIVSGSWFGSESLPRGLMIIGVLIMVVPVSA